MTNTPKFENFIPMQNPGDLQKFILQNKNQQAMNILQQKQPILTPDEFTKQQKELQEKEQNAFLKVKILFDTLGKSPDQVRIRPKLSDLDENNFEEIIHYFARQNMACAFDCCADEETPEHIAEIAKILQKNLGKNEYIHLGLFEDADWEAIKLQNPQYASQFFEVSIANQPQDEAEKQKILQELQHVLQIFRKQND